MRGLYRIGKWIGCSLGPSKMMHPLPAGEQCGEGHGQFMGRLGVGRSVRQVPGFGMKMRWRGMVAFGSERRRGFAIIIRQE